MRVAVLCEFSGVVRDAFIAKGHHAISCDLQPSLSEGPHIRGDIRQIDWEGFDLIIGHPPCTYLCNSGVHLLKKGENWERFVMMGAACEFFNFIRNLDCPRICVENPVPHKYAREYIGKYDQTIQPYQFGHPESKRTCLWLKGLPPLVPTNVLTRDGPWDNQTPSGQNKLGPSKNRANLRSITYRGIAEAMADQWGSL